MLSKIWNHRQTLQDFLQRLNEELVKWVHGNGSDEKSESNLRKY